MAEAPPDSVTQDASGDAWEDAEPWRGLPPTAYVLLAVVLACLLPVIAALVLASR